MDGLELLLERRQCRRVRRQINTLHATAFVVEPDANLPALVKLVLTGLLAALATDIQVGPALAQRLDAHLLAIGRLQSQIVRCRARRIDQLSIVGSRLRLPLRKHEVQQRSEEHTSELQSLMRNSYAVFCLKNNKQTITRK